MPEIYSAATEYIKGLDLGKSAAPQVRGFEWKDPLRQFDEMGRDIPSDLRHWLTLSVEARLEFLKRSVIQRTDEAQDVWQKKLDIRWRNYSFIIQEELRAFTRPELAGRGSRDVITFAVNQILPAREQAKK